MRLNNLKNKKIAILGFGREGKSLLRFLRRREYAQITTRINADKNKILVNQRKYQRKSASKEKPEIWILDRNPKIRQLCINNLWPSQDANINFQLGKNYLKNLDQFDIVFRSPGVPYNMPEIQKAIKKGVKFSSATQLSFDAIHRLTRIRTQINTDKFKNIKIIGVTGTKGKGTTATLLYKILKFCNKKVSLAGNVGLPALEILPKIRVNQFSNPRESVYVILELSSFQLQDLKYSPNIAVVLDIFPDHIDAHKNFNEYFEAKANIAKWQKKTDKIFYFADNKYATLIAQKSKGKKIPIQCQDIGCPSIRKIFGTSNIQKLIKIPGFHNLKNALMATNVSLSLGCPKEKILKVVKNFRGTEHRLEFVRTIRVNPRRYPRISASIKFYNDSASTNPKTAAAAIKAFKEPKILIAGGKDKGLNYSPLAKTLKNSNTKLVILFGENKNKIAKTIKSSGVPIKLVKDLKTTVNLSYKTAKKLLRSMVDGQWSKVIILFSPASASFDMFRDYAERGRVFKDLVRKLK